MKIQDIIPWKTTNAGTVETGTQKSMKFPFQRPWLSLQSLLGGTTFREPEIEFRDAPGEIVVRARLPGIERQDILLKLRKRLLTIRAEHKAEEECLRFGARGWQQSARSYFRAFKIPAQIRSNSVKARFRKGVLLIRLPKIRSASYHQTEDSRATRRRTEGYG